MPEMRRYDAKVLELCSELCMCPDNRRSIRDLSKVAVQRFGWTDKNAYEKLRAATYDGPAAEERARAEERETERQDWVRQ